ncbi:MAG: class I SAM-dependent methyltransferase [Dehalococcoidia bacterium]
MSSAADTIRRLPGARPLAHRLLEAWDSARPLPRPRYTGSAPAVSTGHADLPFLPPSPATVGAAAMAKDAHEYVLALCEGLTPSAHLGGQIAYYQWCRDKFGDYWRYADLPTLLYAATNILQPSSYLEIGVRMGRSASIVGSLRPECAIHGFDLWIRDYGGIENPGPDFVREELRRVGHTGEVTLIAGDSRSTVPAFLGRHPDLYFDLITVDGDHSVLGAAIDIANTLPRLKVGGILAFDDIAQAPALQRVWRELVQRDERFVTWEFTDSGFGIAAAIRVLDAPAADGAQAG